MGGKLTKAQRAALSFILSSGPGTLPLTSAGRTPAAVAHLVECGFLEKLNRLRPGPPMYEITPAGRQALNPPDHGAPVEGGDSARADLSQGGPSSHPDTSAELAGGGA